jgi:hypothetical protein
MQQVCGFIRLAPGIWKYQVHDRFSSALSVLVKGIRQTIADGDHALACICLWQSEISSVKRSPDTQQTPLKVDIRPLKGKYLGHAHPGNSNQEDERTMRFFQMLKKHAYVLWLEAYFRQNWPLVRKPNARDRVQL